MAKFKYQQKFGYEWIYWLTEGREYIGEISVEITGYVRIYKADDNIPCYVPIELMKYLGE